MTSFRWAQVPVVGELLFGAFYKEVPGEKYLLAFHDRERFVTAEALDEMKALMARPGSTYAALHTVRHMRYDDVEPRYRELGVPSVVVAGDGDRVVPLAQAESLAAKLDTELVVLSACGHMPPWERPRGVIGALEALLAKVDDRQLVEAKLSAAPMVSER